LFNNIISASEVIKSVMFLEQIVVPNDSMWGHCILLKPSRA